MTTPHASIETPFSAEFLLALVDDLDQLIRLHDAELDAACVSALKTHGFPDNLALQIADRKLAAGLCDAVASLPEDAKGLDRLAGNFAGIYLTAAYGASPYESVWLSDEHLTCEWPMFEWRQRYAEAGLQVANPKMRYDDHLVLQLLFHQHRLRRAASTNEATDWSKLADELDEHLLYWLPDFAARVVGHCDSAFYGLLSLFTAAWLDTWRDILAEAAHLPRPDRETISARIDRKRTVERTTTAPIRFFPGSEGPSW